MIPIVTFLIDTCQFIFHYNAGRENLKMTKQEILSYWLESSDIDFDAMNALFQSGHYSWSLFLGHLVLEKLLKAYYIQEIDDNIPHIHQLLKIADMARLPLSSAQEELLLEVTTFNIKARYPDYKNRFYKKATKDFSVKYINDITEFRQWLKTMINR